MDWNRVEGNWKQIKGKVKEQWGKLTDDDLDQINGKREQERYRRLVFKPAFPLIQSYLHSLCSKAAVPAAFLLAAWLQSSAKGKQFAIWVAVAQNL
ncbi:CsbD-like [Ensifer sp. OV372]|nr:CsbD-like [Ensifer sp. OV372]